MQTVDAHDQIVASSPAANITSATTSPAHLLGRFSFQRYALKQEQVLQSPADAPVAQIQVSSLATIFAPQESPALNADPNLLALQFALVHRHGVPMFLNRRENATSDLYPAGVSHVGNSTDLSRLAAISAGRSESVVTALIRR